MSGWLQRIDQARAKRILLRSRHQAAQHVPDELYPYWAANAHNEFPGIPSDAVFFAHSLVGLLTFFECTSQSDRTCGLPSRAADSVWHAWLAMDRPGLERFCQRHFQRVIEHRQGAALGDRDLALANCLVQARRVANMAPVSLELPELFLLDRRLKMPGGWAFSVQGGKIEQASLTMARRVEPNTYYPHALSPAGLLEAGLVSHLAYIAYTESLAARQADSGGGGGAEVVNDGGGGGCGGGGCGD